MGSGGFGIPDAAGSGITGDSLLLGSVDGEMTLTLVPATASLCHVHACARTGKVPSTISAAEAVLLRLHIAHYVRCRDSWTHLEDSPETLPGKSPKTKSIPLPATLSSGRLRRDVEATPRPGIILFSWPLLQNVATFSTRAEAGGSGTSRAEPSLPPSSLTLSLASYFRVRPRPFGQQR